ncbi:MAG: CoA transferase [Anaerolineales bacterium]|nr:MAG: CoA transferase [Anaerolineales bacterium]
MVPSTNARSGPLSDLLILDLTLFMAGPYCTQILADLGARVLKIERETGDYTRTLPPHFVKGNSAYFHSLNRNKESVVLDLKAPKGRDVFLRLVQEADIVFENFRPGVMERLGLGYSQLAEANPRIVLCSISGFGQDGPYRERPAYDMIVQALSGSMSITGEPGRRPVRLGIPLGDLAAGMFGAIGALGAFIESKASGQGQHIDVSMLDCQINMLSYPAVYYLVAGDLPGPQGRGHISIPTYRAFTCADNVDVCVTATTEKMWKSLCQMLGMPELVSDPRFITNEDRHRNKEALWEQLDAAFLQRTSQEWLQQLQEFDVPAAPVNTVDRALADVQVQHRNMVVTAQHPDGDTMQLLGNPVKMSRTPGNPCNWPPDVGEHTRLVLQDTLGMTPDEVAALEADGIVFCQPEA